MLKVAETKIDLKLNDQIKNFVLKEKNKWKKDLNNVKALTSGFDPNYPFFDDLYDFSFNYLKKHFTNKFKKYRWWVNYYSESDFTNPHKHLPSAISCILIVKSSPQNPLFFLENEKIHFVDEKDGMIMYFHSDLAHGVNKCTEERITCALDFVPKDNV